MKPTAWEFRNKLTVILNTARQKGQSYVDIESGSLHKDVGGDANAHHRMPVCCEVMMKMMRNGDSILKEPPSEHGATLTIRYVV
jgi:hypothetical protein